MGGGGEEALAESQGILSVELAFTLGNGRVEVNSVEKEALVGLLNISSLLAGGD